MFINIIGLHIAQVSSEIRKSSSGGTTVSALLTKDTRLHCERNEATKFNIIHYMRNIIQ